MTIVARQTIKVKERTCIVITLSAQKSPENHFFKYILMQKLTETKNNQRFVFIKNDTSSRTVNETFHTSQNCSSIYSLPSWQQKITQEKLNAYSVDFRLVKSNSQVIMIWNVLEIKHRFFMVKYLWWGKKY